MIYFLRTDNEAVKIGVSNKKRLKVRITEVRVCNPCEVELVRLIKGFFITERWLHDYFSSHKIKGEWFKFHPEMLTVQIPISIREMETIKPCPVCERLFRPHPSQKECCSPKCDRYYPYKKLLEEIRAT